MQLKGIIFDYGGVLCLHPPDPAVDELVALCGAGRDEFLHAYWSLRASYDRGDLDAIEYWSGIGKLLGRTYSIAEIGEFRQRDIRFWVQLDGRMMNWARRVRAFGLRTAVLSNLPCDLGEHLRNGMRLTGEFDHHSFSYELRVAKPEAAIYRHAVAGLGLAPGEVLFLDDRAENVEGARAAGLRALQFLSPAVLKDQLADLSRSTGSFVPVGTPPVILE
jgi:putative hydrolase of the HAD superfamily